MGTGSLGSVLSWQSVFLGAPGLGCREGRNCMGRARVAASESGVAIYLFFSRVNLLFSDAFASDTKNVTSESKPSLSPPLRRLVREEGRWGV